MIYKFIKLLFMFTKHGINPFLPVETNRHKMIERLSQKDKKWLVSNSNGAAKGYLAAMFDMEWEA